MNAHLHCLVHSIGCSGLQYGCQVHYHAAESVLWSGCCVISQQTWNNIVLVLVILGIWIKITTLCSAKKSMYIHISRWHNFDFGMLGSVVIAQRRRWNSRWRWCRFWYRCTSSFGPPACLRIVCCAILRRKAAIHLILTNHGWESFYRSYHLCMPRKLNSLLLFFAEFGPRFLDQALRLLYSGAWKPFFGHCCLFKATHLLDCSCCTWPPCLAIVADMLKTYKKLVAASKNEIWLLPLPYMTL